ncbi:MAG: DUF7402 domain-containing protein [Propionibacteriaceae bacterium]
MLPAALLVAIASLVSLLVNPQAFAAPVATATGSLDLPREPWWGGPSYYSKFAKASAAGWTDPSFFPISVFLGKPEHAASLRSIGVNTYMGAEHDGSTMASITGTGMSVIAQDEWSTAEVGSDPRVVGWFLSDECEMGYSGCGDNEAAALAMQTSYAATARAKNDGRFLQANFGNGVLSTYWAPTTMDDHVALVDVSSVDKYAYTSPDVRFEINRNPNWSQGDSQRSIAYGWLQDRMETFSSPGASKPNWVFTETAKPYLTEAGSTSITPDQIGGSVWNGLIHGAAGVAYFQHNNNGTCGNYSLVDCAASRAAVAKVNAEVTSMAPVLNSQPYQWNFGTGLQTSLRVYNGDAYIMAMTTGGTGSRTLTLPAGISGSSVEAVGENRTLPITNGTFTDSFAAEYTHHIYRINLGSATTTTTAPAAPSTTPAPTTPTAPAVPTTPTAPASTNLARSVDVTVTASTQNTESGQSAAKAVDGSALGYPVDYTREWASRGERAGAWIQLTWPGAVTLDRVVLNDRPNLTDQITSGTLTFSDGSSVAVGSLANDGSPVTVAFPSRTVTWARLTVDSALDGTANVGLAELQTWGYPAAGLGAVTSPSTGGNAAQAVSAPGSFRSLPPSRILDTRLTGGRIRAGASVSQQVTGVGGVPASGVSAVVLNVTVTDTDSYGYLTVSPTGTARPVVSNLNWSAGATIPNAVTVKVGAGGFVDLYQSGPGGAQVIVDVAGYFVDGSVTEPGGFTSLSPNRILDTRTQGGTLTANESRDLMILGSGGVPASGVSAVVLNVTVTDTTANGYLTVYPSGGARPYASNLNWTPGLTIPNLVTAKVGGNGKVSFYQSGPGTAQVVVDVAGYYLGGSPTQPGMFVALTPARILDTRNTSPVPGNADLALTILGKGGIPATGVSAVMINTTITDTQVPGFLTVYPGTNPLPLASNLNWTAPSSTVANLVNVQTGTDGRIMFRNGSGGNIQLIADTAGYFIGT